MSLLSPTVITAASSLVVSLIHYSKQGLLCLHILVFYNAPSTGRNWELPNTSCYIWFSVTALISTDRCREGTICPVESLCDCLFWDSWCQPYVFGTTRRGPHLMYGKVEEISSTNLPHVNSPHTGLKLTDWQNCLISQIHPQTAPTSIFHMLSKYNKDRIFQYSPITTTTKNPLQFYHQDNKSALNNLYR